jgi:outer membrane protein assembly factor BamB
MKPLTLALAALLLAPAACSTWNPLVAVGIMSEPAFKPTPLAAFKPAVTPRATWTAQVGKGAGFSFRPDSEGGRIYAAAADGTISILDEATGRLARKVETKKPLSGGVEVGDGKIVAGTSKGEVVAMDTDGKLLWTTSVAGEIIAPPAVAAKVVLVRTADGRVFGLSADDGKRKWVFQRPTPALLLRTEAGVQPIGRDVLAGFPNGKLVALDVEDGKLTWEVSVTQPRGTTELERISDIAGLPVIDGGTVCASAYQSKVSCIDIQSRNVLWSRDLSSSRALVNDAKLLYVVDDTGSVHGLDKVSGASVWKQDKLRYRKLTSPVVHEGLLVVGDGLGFLHVLSPEDGAIIGRLPTDGSAIRWIVPATGGLALQTEKGSVSLVKF